MELVEINVSGILILKAFIRFVQGIGLLWIIGGYNLLLLVPTLMCFGGEGYGDYRFLPKSVCSFGVPSMRFYQ